MSIDHGEYAIRVNQVSKVYKLYSNKTDRLKEAVFGWGRSYHKDFYAVNDISFDIKKGETVGIIGKNGSGKSTLLKMITGVLNASSGTIEVDGKISALLELGAGFNLEYTGLENVYLNGTIMGYSKKEIDEKLDEIIHFADIGEFIHQPVKMYSSGMFVRLAFAVAINVDPDILIVDEALAVGDAAFQVKCFRKFNEFKKMGKTILFVAHSMDLILRYCDRAVVLNNGIMSAHGQTKDMVDIYKKILAGLLDESIEGDIVNSHKVHSNGQKSWKESFLQNKDMLAYGDHSVEIIDYGVFDGNGNPTININGDESINVTLKVKFNVDITDPIFAFTIKDVKGLELTGANTLYANVDTGYFKKSDEVTIAFTQKLRLQSSDYTLSLGCTGFSGDELVVYHRLYDVLILTISNARRIVGMYDISSTIDVKRMG